MGKKYELTSIRVQNMISIQQVFMDGSRHEIGRFMLPGDNQWRLDIDLLDEIMAAYKKRLRKAL